MTPLLSVKAVAERLNASESFVRHLLASGRMRHYVLGRGQGGKRVSEEQLAEYLAATERGGAPDLPAAVGAKRPPRKKGRLP